MSWLVATVREVVGLFVTDWEETAVILGILLVAWGATVARMSDGAGFAVAAALGVQLLVFTTLDARRRRRG